MLSRLAVGLALLAALVAVAAGCGSVGQTSADEGSAALGKQLFMGKGQCGNCHALADAGSRGEIGPDLDAAFRNLREQGFDESTIRDVVRGQIAYPTVNPAGFDEEGKPIQGMPANLVTGQDAIDVAVYVASVAGKDVEGREAAPTPTDGKTIFTQTCGGCHVLAAAGTSGTVGPSLDQLRPDAQRVIAAVRRGPGAMPSFEGQLSDEQIEAVAKFVADNAGK